jgi:hypothetical protein
VYHISIDGTGGIGRRLHSIYLSSLSTETHRNYNSGYIYERGSGLGLYFYPYTVGITVKGLRNGRSPATELSVNHYYTQLSVKLQVPLPLKSLYDPVVVNLA